MGLQADPHLGEQVPGAAGDGVGADARQDAVVQAGAKRGKAHAHPEFGLGGDAHPGTGVGEQSPLVVGERGTVDVQVPRAQQTVVVEFAQAPEQDRGGRGAGVRGDSDVQLRGETDLRGGVGEREGAEVTEQSARPTARDRGPAAGPRAPADPVWLEIVPRLAVTGQESCNTIGGDLDVHQTTLSHHYRVPREAGITWTTIQGRSRLVRLRHHDLDTLFPDLLDSVLNGAVAGMRPREADARRAAPPTARTARAAPAVASVGRMPPRRICHGPVGELPPRRRRDALFEPYCGWEPRDAGLTTRSWILPRPARWEVSRRPPVPDAGSRATARRFRGGGVRHSG
ncbi:ArsR/SmtB family transcription factor [Embleya sp. NPDC059267]|uniref:ArsR/SmtB family transcription factor n=1 Tax=unclassified Embleya TaxID=2699296 RepID=UPI0036B3DE43